MAAKRQSNEDEAQPVQAGNTAVQSIVELLSATHCGLVFWSRHPFEVASELQIRVRASALPTDTHGSGGQRRGGWVMKRGFVVQSKPARRPDGSVGFHVSLLFVPATNTPEGLGGASKRGKPARKRACKYGLN